MQWKYLDVCCSSDHCSCLSRSRATAWRYFSETLFSIHALHTMLCCFIFVYLWVVKYIFVIQTKIELDLADLIISFIKWNLFLASLISMFLRYMPEYCVNLQNVSYLLINKCIKIEIKNCYCVNFSSKFLKWIKTKLILKKMLKGGRKSWEKFRKILISSVFHSHVSCIWTPSIGSSAKFTATIKLVTGIHSLQSQ